jgi:hypothetical protein
MTNALCCCLMMMAPGFEDKLADAIYSVEGGSRAKRPYGILSQPVRNKAHAREVTIQSIRNSWHRWHMADYPDDFLTFFGRRWAPPNLSPKNRHWVENVRKRL